MSSNPQKYFSDSSPQKNTHRQQTAKAEEREIKKLLTETGLSERTVNGICKLYGKAKA